MTSIRTCRSGVAMLFRASGVEYPLGLAPGTWVVDLNGESCQASDGRSQLPNWREWVISDKS